MASFLNFFLAFLHCVFVLSRGEKFFLMLLEKVCFHSVSWIWCASVNLSCVEMRTYSTFWIKLDSGFGGSCRGFNSTTSPEESAIKLEEEQMKIENDDSFFEEEISKLRREFTAAKQSFLKIPEAVKAMPKMNPEGHSLFWLIIILLLFSWIYFVFHDRSNFDCHFYTEIRYICQ